MKPWWTLAASDQIDVKFWTPTFDGRCEGLHNTYIHAQTRVEQ